MKHILIILALFLALRAHADHLTFLGMPIDGSITEFQSKLTSKGFKHNVAASKNTPAGERIFSGAIQGHKANLSVFYNRKTCKVYEVKISFKYPDIDDAQKMLEKTQKLIESRYAYIPEHDVEDGHNLHFRYHILPKSTDTNTIGTIHVTPTYSYIFNNGEQVGTIYVIQLNLEDSQNSALLTPSTTKPKGTKNLCLNDPEKFYKYLVWANEFKKAADFDKLIDYLTYSLDYFKFNCVPPNANVTEQEIEDEIIAAQACCIGKIRTWANSKLSNLYKGVDTETSELFLTFPANMGLIRISLHDLPAYIEEMTKIRNIFMTKIAECLDKELSPHWNETADCTMTVNYGEDSKQGQFGFGDYRWANEPLILHFENSKLGPYLEICTKRKSYMPIMTFANSAQFDEHLRVLLAVKSELKTFHNETSRLSRKMVE